MLVGQQIGGVFAIEKELGHGAMGMVYRARYTKTGQTVAIKIISPGQIDNDRNLARFDREVTILKQLKHPNIVRLYAHGRYKGTPFFAMEYIEGESLDRVLERRGRFTWEEVIALGKQLCAALQHAHLQGIIHRDLKPSNVMMLQDGTVKLTDFGIAKDMDRTELTAANCAVGTAAYMSPEQCRGERQLSNKSDLYCLGVMFYELVTGRKPFIADTPMAMFLLHTEGDFERPSRLVLEIPIWLDTLICQLLEKLPDKRPLDAAMVGKALTEVEEKVTAQRSAGVDAVKARAIDRPRGQRKPAEEDREAARALKAAVSKKKPRKAKPFFKRVWFQGLMLGSLLAVLIVGMALMLYLSTRPERADVLYKQIQRKMEAGTIESMLEARDGPVKDYLENYGDNTDEQTLQVRAWKDEIDVADRERKLRNPNLFKFLDSDDRAGQAKATAKAAIDSETESGDLDAAAKRWQELEKLKTEGDRNLQIWGLLATRRLKEIAEVKRLEQSLERKVQEAREFGSEYKTDSEFDALALQAVRLEQFGDKGNAAETWRDLKRKSEEAVEQQRKSDQYIRSRLWPLIATKKVADLKSSATPEEKRKARLKLLDDRLIEAQMKSQSKTAEARFLCRELIALYEKDSEKEIVQRVQQARHLLDTELK